MATLSQVTSTVMKRWASVLCASMLLVWLPRVTTLDLAASPAAGPPQTRAGIADRYPKDVNIETNPNVIFVEEFEDSIADVIARWTDHLENTSYIDTDVPPGSPAGSHSIAIPRTPKDMGGHFLKSWPTNYDRLYARFYIKFTSPPHHSGVWLGGEKVTGGPRYPDPHAGLPPCRIDECAKQDRAAWFWSSAEPSPYGFFDSYSAFLNMRPDGKGTHWGNMLTMNKSARIPANTWTCVEHMIKVNDVGDTNGEYAMWLNGETLSELGKGFPAGAWEGGQFTQTRNGRPFGGIEWRDDAGFGVNYIWMQNYNETNNIVWYDHLVVATSHIGCMAP
jgi:hypothetical protein